MDWEESQFVFLKIWGCEAFVKKLMSNKLTPKSDKYIFVGYRRETLGYSFYNWEKNKVFVARNGVFLEKEFLSREASGRTVRLKEIRGPLGDGLAGDEIIPELVREPVVEAAPEPRRSERLHRVRDVLLLESDEPATYAEAMVSPDSEACLEAMRSKLKSMDENQVWDLVDPPPGITAIGCKWVFKKKTDVDGNVRIHKSWLVAKNVMDKFKELIMTRPTRW